MGVMNKLRENTGVVLWILVLAFGGLWMLQDSGVFDVIGNPAGQNIAIVNGDPISVDDYQNALNAQMEQYQAQSGESMPPQMLDLTRERVFDALVEDRLAQQEMERLGITVTDQEVYDMVLGDNPHPIIGVYFSDGQGGVNRTLLQNFAQDPAAREQWIQLEQYLRTERRREKLANLIAASVRVTDQDVMDEYNRRNRTADVEYVALRYAAIPDDSVQVTDSDLRKFYNEHRNEFERPRTVRLNYVTVSKAPSPQDTLAITNELNQIKERFAAAEDDSTFLARNGSEVPYSDQYYGPDDMRPELATAVFDDPQAGEIVGPIIAGNEAHLVKIQAVRQSDQPVVRARHILFSAEEGDEAARAQARQQAQEVKQQLDSGADFEALARQHSDDGSAAQGGDLGWFGRGRMVQPFEEAAFSATAGRVVGPVATQFGYHLIQVTDRATQEVQIADYGLRIRPNVATLNAIQEDLDDLQYFSSESGNFVEEAESRNLPVQTVQVEADQEFIPGIGNSRNLMTFVETAKEGNVSEVIELNDQFIVASAAEVLKEGVRPFESVRAELEPRARIEKKSEIQAARLQQALQQGGFEGLAQRVGQQLQTASSVGYSSPVVPGLGREPKFVGTALGLAEGAVSEVIKGDNAAYVIRTTSVREPAPLSAEMRNQIRQQLLNVRRASTMQQWLSTLREDADVDDYRRQFNL